MLDRVCGFPQVAAQFVVDLRQTPAGAHLVLQPLEVRHGHAASVGENVGEYLDAPVDEDLLGVDGCRSVRSLEDRRGLDVRRTSLGDLVLDGCGHEYVNIGSEEVFDVDVFAARKASYAAGFVGVAPQFLGVDAVAVGDGPGVVGDVGDRHAHAAERTSAVFADVSESLNCGGGASRVLAGSFVMVGEHKRCALARCLVTTDRTAGLDRLARDDATSVLALDAAAARVHEGVHHPDHVPRRRADVGGGDVVFGADVGAQRMGEPANDSFDLANAMFTWVEGDAAFGTTEGHVGERRLPRHPHRKCLDLTEFYIGGKAQAALVRAEGIVVLNSVAAKHSLLAVIHFHREADDDLVLWTTQQLTHRIRQSDHVCGCVELFNRCLEQFVAVAGVFRPSGRHVHFSSLPSVVDGLAEETGVPFRNPQN